MKTRVITGIVMGIFLIPALFFEEYFLLIGSLLLMGAVYELYKMFNKDEKINLFVLSFIMICSISVYVVILLATVYSEISLDVFFVSLLMISVLIIYASVLFKRFTLDNIANLSLSILYPVFGFAALVFLNSVSVYTILYILIVAMSTDIFAYTFGSQIGKHKIAPTISPNKSVEGCVAGLIFGVVFGTMFAYFTDLFEIIDISFSIGNTNINFLVYIVLSIYISFAGQMGDFFASYLKRHFGIKDFSKLFPGHGGVLDRFDSSIFAALNFMLALLIIGLF